MCLPRPYGDLSPPNRKAALRFLCKPYGDLTVLSCRHVIASLAFFLNLTLNFFSETAMPQRCNHIARSPYGGCTVTLRLPWDGIRFLPCLGRLENHRAASRCPCGGLTAPLRRPYGKLLIAAKNMRSPHGHLPVSLRSPYSFLFNELYDRRAVAVTFVNTTTLARKTLRFLIIMFYKP